MTDEVNAAEWYWLRPDREQAQGSFQELTALLSARALPRSTMVWMDPWPEWRPAHRVPELAAILPPSLGRGKKSAEPGLAESASPPDARAGAPKVPRPDPPRPTSNTATPTAPAVASAGVTIQTGTPELAASTSAAAPATEGAAAPEAAPTAAVVEAPAAPEAALSAGRAAPERVSMKEAAAAESAAPDAPDARLPEAPPRREEDWRPLESSFKEARRRFVTSEAPVELAAEPPLAARDTSRTLRIALVSTAAACAVLAIALAFSLRALGRRAPAPAAAPPPPTAAVVPGCTLLTPPARLAESVERDVMPSLTPLDGGRVAIGFATTPREARGIVVRLDTLAAAPAFTQAGEQAVIGVIPQSGAANSFNVDRDDGSLTVGASLDGSPRAILGADKERLVRRVEGQPPSSLWPLTKPPVTVPRLARLDNRGGYVVAVRQGGASGSLGIGWLDADGAAVGELRPIDAGVQFFGSPAVAANSGGALVAFAGRDSEAEPWRVRVARANPRSAPDSVVDVPMEREELGAGAIAPALSAFGDGRWLLQWTQGEVGRLQVRVQLLSDALRPIAAPLLVSPMGANAGQGSVWVLGDRVLSLFVLPVPGRDELWGSVLQCR